MPKKRAISPAGFFSRIPCKVQLKIKGEKMPLSTKMMATVPKLNEGGTILAEAIVWSLIICVPINVVSITFAMQAPSYIHPDKESFDYGYGYNSIYTANETDAPKLNNSNTTTMLNVVDNFVVPILSTVDRRAEIGLGSTIATTSPSINNDLVEQKRESILEESSEPEVVPTSTSSKRGRATTNLSNYCYAIDAYAEHLLLTSDFWISGVGLISVGGMGLIGNILTLMVLAVECKESRNSFNRLLIYMAVVDSLLIISCVLEFSLFNIFLGYQPHWFIVAFPYFLHPVKHILLSMCIFTLVAVSSERCQAICHPLRSRPSPGVYMLTVTVLSIMLNARKFFEFQHDRKGEDYETTSLMEYPPYIVFSNTWQEIIVTGLLPFIALLICNARIYMKIKESKKHESHRFVGKVTTAEDATQLPTPGMTSIAGSTVGGRSGIRGAYDEVIPMIEITDQIPATDMPERRRSTFSFSSSSKKPTTNNMSPRSTSLKNDSPSEKMVAQVVKGEGGDRKREAVPAFASAPETPPPVGQNKASVFGDTLNAGDARRKSFSRDDHSIIDDDCASIVSTDFFRTSRSPSYCASMRPRHLPISPSVNRVLSMSGRKNSTRPDGGKLSQGQRKLRKRHEKSVVILILIIAVFLLCHSFRLGVQTYQTFHSAQSTKEHFMYCQELNKLPYPVTFLVLIAFNNLFLVFNSSINFAIYCAVRKSFRTRIWTILKAPFACSKKYIMRNFSLRSAERSSHVGHNAQMASL